MNKLNILQEKRLDLIKDIQNRREEIRKRCQDTGITTGQLDKREEVETQPYKKELEQIKIKIEDELTNREEYRKSWKSKLGWIILTAILSIAGTLLVQYLFKALSVPSSSL